MKMIMTLNGRVCEYSSVSWVLPNSHSGRPRVSYQCLYRRGRHMPLTVEEIDQP